MPPKLIAKTRNNIIKLFGSNKKYFNTKLLFDNFDSWTVNTTNSIGANYPENMGYVVDKLLKFKTIEERKIGIIKLAMDLTLGNEKLPRMPADPMGEGLSNNRFIDRFSGNIEFITNILDYCHPYLNENLGFNKESNSLGTGYMNFDDTSHKPEFNNLYRTALEESKNNVSFIIRKCDSEADVLKEYANDDNLKTKEDKDAFFDKAFKSLEETAKAHYGRKKPGFLARFFRTKAAREYKKGDEALQKMASLVFNSGSDKKIDLSYFLDRNKYLNNVNNLPKNPAVDDINKYQEMYKAEKNLELYVLKNNFAYELKEHSKDKELKDLETKYDEKINNSLEKEMHLFDEKDEIENIEVNNVYNKVMSEEKVSLFKDDEEMFNENTISNLENSEVKDEKLDIDPIEIKNK